MKNNYPEIRFAGYEIEWSMKKLGDITDIKDSSRISNTLWISNGVPYLRSSDLSNDNIKGELFLSKKTYQEYSAKTGAPTRGDLLFTSGGKIGVTYYKEDDDELYVQGGSILYAKTSESEHLNGRFLKSYFDTPILKKYIENASTGLTIKHFTLKPAKDTPIAIPELDEQKKIGLFFKNLDDTISLHQQELDALKKAKQSFLKKMFPKERETTPNLRLKGYLEKWTTVKLEEKINIFNNLRVPVTSSNRVKGKIPYYGANGIQDYVEGCTHDGEFVLIAEDGANDLINYPVQYVTGKVWVNNHAHVVSGKSQKLDTLFLKYRINSMSISKYLVGGGRSKLNLEALKKLLIVIPSFEEQVEIGSFFRQLDEVIELKEQELEALKETKKGFLQKMFV